MPRRAHNFIQRLLYDFSGDLSIHATVKVIHNALFERRVLASIGITLDCVYDTREASREARGPDTLGGHSLAMVCERELGVSLDKAAQTSNWSRRPLSPDQLQYAALDAEILLMLYDNARQPRQDAPPGSQARAN